MPNMQDTRTDDRLETELVNALMPAGDLHTAYDQLKPFERQFVDAYLSTDSPLKAMREIFPGNGLTAKQLKEAHKTRAFELIRRPLVQAAIAERLARIAGQFELTTERVLAEVAKIAYANMDDYFTVGADGKRSLNLDNATRDQMAAVGKIKVSRRTDKATGDVTEDIEFALHDKLNALEKAMKRLNLFAPTQVDFRGVISTAPGENGRHTITVDMTDEQAGLAYELYLRGD